MATLNLLDINVDSLFEQCSISEIDQVHKKLQLSIEEKKEELRMMVGERYRDLLQAADTIGDMRKTSSNVIRHIDGIISSCRSLNEHQLIGFKIDETNAKSELNSSSSNSSSLPPLETSQRNYYGCIAQIHLFTRLPELIWSRLDDEDYFVATQLFIFARHISTGLQLDTNIDIMQKFPVAKRQWNHLNQFFFMIKQVCLQQLERPELSTETAVKCLASLLLLENCQLEKLLTMFIQLRTRAFRQMLTNTNTSMDNTKMAKDRILASLQLLNETIFQLFKCFIHVSGNSDDDYDTNQVGNDDSGKCYLVKEIELITGPNAKPVLSMINLDDSLLVQTLPTLISKFKPQIKIQPIDANAIQRALETWIKCTEQDSKQFLKAVIDNIGSVRTIHNINKAVLELEKPSNWQTILQKLHLSGNIDFYQMFYLPLIQDRIKSIITSSWAAAIERTEKEICELLAASDSNWTIKKLFWAEESSDNPLSLKQALDTNRVNHRLLMKNKGFTSDVCAICNTLDKHVESIYNDLRLYVNSTTSDGRIHMRDDPNVRKEQENVVEFLRNCSQDGTMQLITKVKALANEKSEQQHFIIFLARLLKAITEICPHVKQCQMPAALLLSTNTWIDQNHPTSIKHWERMCRLLDEETINLWRKWIELFVSDRLRENNGLCFAIDIDLTMLLSIFPNWETYAIEEKDDSNLSVESTIRVPAHPSIPLQRFLFNCCTQLNAYVPNTLPKQITALLAERLIDRLINTYAELIATNAFVVANQNASLQFYFDLKFLALLFLGGRRHDELHSITAKFKANIDPFDFELFHKYINANVKLSAQRMQHQYGLLVASLQPLQSIFAAMAKQGGLNKVAQHKDPNLLPLCASGANSNWFAMLPIVAPSSKAAITSSEAIAEAVPTQIMGSNKTATQKTEKRKSPSKTANASGAAQQQSTAQQNIANVKSNAAAFFGAMSQDWFR